MKRRISVMFFCVLFGLCTQLFAWITGPDPTPTTAPEITVKGQNSSAVWNPILDNSTTSSFDNGTNFGIVDSIKVTKFRIQNDGNTSLVLNYPLVSISGSSNFSIGDDGIDNAIINQDGYEDFTIKYLPQSAEKDSAKVIIYSTDPDENPFTFIITGSGSTPYSINTTIWHDSNNNGMIDKNEKGLENVIVNLLQNDIQITKHYSNTRGQCQFTFLQENTYTVEIRESSLPKDAICTTGGLTTNVNIKPENGWVDIKFGFHGDQVENKAGDPVIHDPEEPNLPGNTLVIVPETGTPTCIFGKCETNWDNLVDMDYEGWDGTVVAATPQDGSDPQVIMEFFDHNIYKFNYVQYQTDNGTDDDNAKNNAQADKVELFVSTTGLDDTDFESIGTFECSYGRTKMQWFQLEDYVCAKYIKLVITKPTSSRHNKQLVEFAVNTKAKTGAVPASDSGQEFVQLPQKSQLLKSYPNPFNPTVSIPFELDQKDHVNLTIYDLQGRLVAELANADFNSGKHEITWNGVTFPSGVYFVNFRTTRTNQNQSIVLLK